MSTSKRTKPSTNSAEMKTKEVEKEKEIEEEEEEEEENVKIYYNKDSEIMYDNLYIDNTFVMHMDHFALQMDDDNLIIDQYNNNNNNNNNINNNNEEDIENELLGSNIFSNSMNNQNILYGNNNGNDIINNYGYTKDELLESIGNDTPIQIQKEEEDHEDEDNENREENEEDEDDKDRLSKKLLTSKNENIPLVSTLKIHEDCITDISIGRNNIATVGDDYRLVLYTINDQLQQKLRCGYQNIRKSMPLGVSLNSTGEYLAIAGVDGTIEILDVNVMKSICCLQGHTGSVLKVQWSPAQNNLLASYANDQAIRVWHPQSGSKKWNQCHIIKEAVEYEKEQIMDMKWQNVTTQIPLLGYSNSNGTLRLLDMRYLPIQTSSASSYSNNSLTKEHWIARSIGNKFVYGSSHIIGINGMNMNIVDSVACRRGGILKKHKTFITACDITTTNNIKFSNMDLVVSGDENNDIYLWNVHHQHCQGNFIRQISDSVDVQEQSSQSLENINSSGSNSNNNSNIVASTTPRRKFKNRQLITNLKFFNQNNHRWLISTNKSGMVKLWDCSQCI